MDDWVIWLIVAVTLGVAEIFTLTMVLGMFGGAALFAALAAAIGLPVPLQMVVFTVALGAGLVVVRPVARRHLRQPPPDQRFGVQALVGRPAYVLREVTGRDGRVQIGGEEWSARAYDETLVIPAGAVVDVIEIEGATALVYPRE
ncbi:NfeD family protein [Streptosporangium fragile]|uniref:NfeD family protein n=1 Tax=Streptosporangium fragile TaxID=46186 RepID=A0ABN3VWY5_9ACTN